MISVEVAVLPAVLPARFAMGFSYPPLLSGLFLEES
jgi:hypothetical protein